MFVPPKIKLKSTANKASICFSSLKNETKVTSTFPFWRISLGHCRCVDYMASNGDVTGELGRIWKEAVMVKSPYYRCWRDTRNRRSDCCWFGILQAEDLHCDTKLGCGIMTFIPSTVWRQRGPHVKAVLCRRNVCPLIKFGLPL
jgi:hypothetical protein